MGLVLLLGEVTSRGTIDYTAVVRATLEQIGYTVVGNRGSLVKGAELVKILSPLVYLSFILADL